MFLVIVLDGLLTVRQVLAHRGIDIHLLRYCMPDNLADHGVREIPALVGVGGRRDAVEEVQCLSMIGHQLANYVNIGALAGHISLRIGCGTAGEYPPPPS